MRRPVIDLPALACRRRSMGWSIGHGASLGGQAVKALALFGMRAPKRCIREMERRSTRAVPVGGVRLFGFLARELVKSVRRVTREAQFY
jgi:hypothetical protein